MSLADDRLMIRARAGNGDERNVRPEDLVVAGLCLVGAIVVVVDSVPRYVGRQGMGSGAFPTWVAIFVAICGLLVIGRAVRERGLAPAEAWPRGQGLRRLLLAAGSLLAYLFALPVLGFTISTALLLIFHFRVLGAYSWKAAVLIGTVSALVIWVIFAGLLFMSLPRGLVGF